MNDYCKTVNGDSRLYCSTKGCWRLARHRVTYKKVQPADLCCEPHAHWRQTTIPGASVRPLKETP